MRIANIGIQNNNICSRFHQTNRINNEQKTNHHNIESNDKNVSFGRDTNTSFLLGCLAAVIVVWVLVKACTGAYNTQFSQNEKSPQKNRIEQLENDRNFLYKTTPEQKRTIDSLIYENAMKDSIIASVAKAK